MKASAWLWIANFALVRLTYSHFGPAVAISAWAGLGVLIGTGQAIARRRRRRREELLTRLAAAMRRAAER